MKTFFTVFLSQILSATLFRLYANDHGMLIIILEELIRRGHLHASAVVRFLVQLEDFPDTLLSTPVIMDILNLLQNLSFDFVRASLLHRQSFGGDLIDLHESANLAPSEEPESNEPHEAEAEAELMEDADEDNERKRARVSSMESSSNAIWAADESLKLSVKNARYLYRSLIEFTAAILTGNHSRSQGPNSDILRSYCLALTQHCWRGYFGFQTQISFQLSQRIVIVDASIKDATDAMQLVEPAAMRAWSKYL